MKNIEQEYTPIGIYSYTFSNFARKILITGKCAPVGHRFIMVLLQAQKNDEFITYYIYSYIYTTTVSRKTMGIWVQKQSGYRNKIKLYIQIIVDKCNNTQQYQISNANMQQNISRTSRLSGNNNRNSKNSGQLSTIFLQ